MVTDAARIALSVPDVGSGILRELCERYQANFDEVKYQLLLRHLMFAVWLSSNGVSAIQLGYY